MKTALITGITGQDGSYLAELLLNKGYVVHGIIRRASTFNTVRVDHIYSDIHDPKTRLFMHYGDLADTEQVSNLIYNVKPDEVYHLGAQSHVRVSFDIPEYTGNITALGTTRILEAIRRSGNPIKYYQASSSEMFGASPPPQSETTPFTPRSPYAAAKLYAYWMAVNYRDGYKMFASNGILFNHECVTAQTPVIIKKNNVMDITAIEEIVPHRENPRHGIKYSTIANNDFEVWDGDKWTRIKTLTATWNRADTHQNKEVIRVICRGGYYEATKDHISFLDGSKEVKTGNLKGGDKLELKTFPELNKMTVLSSEEAEFLGMMAADGYVSSDGKGRLINNDKNLRNRIQELWQKISGGTSCESKHPSGFVKGESVYSIELTGNRQYLRMVHGEIYNQKLFKKVPQRILNADIDIIHAFLRGYNACDGLKGGRQKTEFKSFTTNSSVLALGLWYLVNKALELRATVHPEFRKDKLYFHLNVNSNNKNSKGKHIQRELSEIKSIKKYDYTGWLFDLETESGTFSAGIGLTWIHNSPRRGETFVTRKITRAIAAIIAKKQDKLYLGNLDAERDWGYAPEYVEGMWAILQEKNPDNFVLGTGETHSVRNFVEEAFKYAGKDYEKHVSIDPRYYRPTEVERLRADISKAKKALNWSPKIAFKDLVKIMVDADMRAAGQKPIGEGDEILKRKFPNRWWGTD